MIPLWMLAPAIAVGNVFILKPSERTLPLPFGSTAVAKSVYARRRAGPEPAEP